MTFGKLTAKVSNYYYDTIIILVKRHQKLEDLFARKDKKGAPSMYLLIVGTQTIIVYRRLGLLTLLFPRPIHWSIYHPSQYTGHDGANGGAATSHYRGKTFFDRSCLTTKIEAKGHSNDTQNHRKCGTV